MTKAALLVLTTLLITQSAISGESIDGISIQVVPKKKFFLLGGPAVLYVTISNHRKELIQVTANCQPLEKVTFSITAPDGSKLKPRLPGNMEEDAQRKGHGSFKPLASEDHVTYALVLNHQFLLSIVGTYKVDMTIHASAITRTAGKRPEKIGGGDYQASTAFELKDASAKELEEELETWRQLLNERDRHKAYEAVDALCYLDTPITIKYLKDVVDADNKRPVDAFDFYASLSGIEALTRFGTEEAMQWVHRKLFAGKNSQVDSVLAAYAARKILLPEEDIERLKNRKSHWALLRYLGEVGTEAHLDYLKQFETSDNESVRDIARDGVAAINKRNQKK